jgi:Family of unknown function (DUF5995)
MLGLAAVLATASVAAAARASEVPNPPWPQLLPPFPIAESAQPGPIPHCRRGRLRCVTRTIRRMRREQERLGCDHRAVFTTTYLTLSKVLRRAIRDGLFEDRRYLSYQVTHFANYYFRTLRMNERGEPVPEAWRIAMDTAASGGANATQDMLLGINAHVQRDMPYVVAELGLATPSGESRKGDHDAGNEALNDAYEAVVAAVRERYDEQVGLTNPALLPHDDLLGLEMVKGWREGVWRNAERLVNAETPEERRQVEDSIEANAAAWARTIATPGQPGYRAQRDAYCQAQLGS